MSITRTHSNSRDRAVARGGLTINFAGTAMAIVVLAANLHPNPVILPLLSVILVTAGIVWSGIVTLIHGKAADIPLQDRLLGPALIIFTGFAAAIMGDPDIALQSLNGG